MLSSMMAARCLICASSQIVSRPAGLGLTRHGTLMITATLSDMGRNREFTRNICKLWLKGLSTANKRPYGYSYSLITELITEITESGFIFHQ
jgi:hypothetical protein